MSADFFFTNEEFCIVTGDDEGIIRVYEYSPHGNEFDMFLLDTISDHSIDPDSSDGRYLLLQTEFHCQSEYRARKTIAHRVRDHSDIPQSKLLMGLSMAPLLFLNNQNKGSPDGSLSSLTPVEESAFKRLQLLQGQLTRNIQHIAGLNPRAFR